LDEAGLISTQQGRGTYIWEAPSESTTVQLRQHALQGLTRRYLAEAAHLGCSPEDVEKAMEPLVVSWKTGHLPDDEN
jgi:DNA-binding transcriptional regulator YhcF (GntR family)